MDPRTRDHIRRWAGAATRDAVPDTEPVAEEWGVSRRQIRHYRTGHQSSPTVRYLEWLATVERPWREVAHASSFVKHATVREMKTAALVERWWALSDAEHDREADQNRHHANGDSADDEVLADERHAAVLLERAAVRKELHIRGVNPRDFSQEAA